MVRCPPFLWTLGNASHTALNSVPERPSRERVSPSHLNWCEGRSKASSRSPPAGSLPPAGLDDVLHLGDEGGGAAEAVPGPAPEDVEGLSLAILAELSACGDLPLCLLIQDELLGVVGDAIGGDDGGSDPLREARAIAELGRQGVHVEVVWAGVETEAKMARRGGWS